MQRYLQESVPDVLMIQELKGLEFPEDVFKDAGYHCAFVPQKAYNGVAVICKNPPAVLHTKLPGDDADEQARYLEFEMDGVRLINIYAPNGNPVDSEKFTYKLSWLDRLFQYLSKLREQRIAFAIGGDFNIIPEEADCYDPKAWAEDALFRPEARAAYRRLIHLGLSDAFRVFDQRRGQYTFWDYQAGRWHNDQGIRIDHFLLSPELTDRLINCSIDRGPRDWDKPSDHTPITIEIKI